MTSGSVSKQRRNPLICRTSGFRRDVLQKAVIKKLNKEVLLRQNQRKSNSESRGKKRENFICNFIRCPASVNQNNILGGICFPYLLKNADIFFTGFSQHLRALLVDFRGTVASRNPIAAGIGIQIQKNAQIGSKNIGAAEIGVENPVEQLRCSLINKRRVVIAGAKNICPAFQKTAYAEA